MTGNQGWVWSLAFHPNGKLLASSGTDSILLWDLGKSPPEVVKPPPPKRHSGTVKSVAFSGDGQWLASAGAWRETDNVVLLWDPNLRMAIGPPLLGHRGEVWSVAFSPDGKTLASAGDQGVVLLRTIDPDTWMRAAEDIGERDITNSSLRCPAMNDRTSEAEAPPPGGTARSDGGPAVNQFAASIPVKEESSR